MSTINCTTVYLSSSRFVHSELTTVSRSMGRRPPIHIDSQQTAHKEDHNPFDSAPSTPYQAVKRSRNGIAVRERRRSKNKSAKIYNWREIIIRSACGVQYCLTRAPNISSVRYNSSAEMYL